MLREISPLRYVRMPDADTRQFKRVRLLTGELAVPGAFLARLWSAFGPPNEVEFETFAYHPFRDVETGVLISAYVGIDGPALGADPNQNAATLTAALDAFEGLLVAMPMKACAVEYYSPLGVYRCGVQDGAVFGYSIYWHELGLPPESIE